MRLHALCAGPLLRLALIGGEYGQVTFKGKTSPKTIAFDSRLLAAAGRPRQPAQYRGSRRNDRGDRNQRAARIFPVIS
jgi:hypothetical protein